jgi:hypothetical protein
VSHQIQGNNSATDGVGTLRTSVTHFLRPAEVVLAAVAGAATLAALQEDWLALGIIFPTIEGTARVDLPAWKRVVWLMLDHTDILPILAAVLIIGMLVATVAHAVRRGREVLLCASLAGAIIACSIVVVSLALRNHTDQNLGTFTPIRSGGIACLLIAVLISTAWLHQVALRQSVTSDTRRTENIMPSPALIVGAIVMAVVGVIAVVAAQRFWLAAGIHVMSRTMESGPPLMSWERSAFEATARFHQIDWIVGTGITLYVCLAGLGVWSRRRYAGWAAALAGVIPVVGGVYYHETVSAHLSPSFPGYVLVAAIIAAVILGGTGLARALVARPGPAIS